ncbi:aliphatic sulfonate ABC transporter substrate-binding protein [Brevibacillus dissolubilis]|uniref:aliphatic sulfonate ABC transporter substrate-binding protein n=1 Tax=Brevibacillus dissolubilis TaxID=1844116 RepID=UPI0011166681|nr:aliphatic sulfonate ABC transporter substrate-binding protein [Brevibacillus dissolubilis]
MKLLYPRFSFFTCFLIIALVLTQAGCAATQAVDKPADKVRFGYFPNLTHITAIIGLEKGYFQEALGDQVKLEARQYTSGGLFMEAMSTQQVDFGYTGPGPALNIYSRHPAHQILAGAVNGGTVLMVRPDSGIKSIEDLNGKSVLIPGIGNTQDLMMQKALKDAGLAPTSQGGSVQLITTAPADAANFFLQKNADAAAMPEPWGVNLEEKAGAEVLYDSGNFAWGLTVPTTVVAARNSFTKVNPEMVKKLLVAHQKATDFINEHPEEAVELFIKHIKATTGKEMKKEPLQKALASMEVTTAVHEIILQEMAKVSREAGYITTEKIDGLVNLSYLPATSE